MPIIGGRQVGVRGLGFQGAGKPNQVTGLTATDFGTSRAFNNGRIDLSWTAPANNGAPITGYRIERSTDNVSYSAISVNTGTTATSYSDTGLNSNQIYYYKVAAINAVDTGPLSTAANATSTTVPQAPTIGTATAGDSSATVTYTAGATGGKAVTAYTATSSPGSITGTGSSPITVSGLTNGTAYTFTVTATNANGTSTASSASNSATPVAPYTLVSDYTTSTTYTIPSGKTKLAAFLIGAGGSVGRGGTATGDPGMRSGAGAGGGGGGAGGWFKDFTVTPGDVFTITIGAGTQGGNSANVAGVAGGATSLVRSGVTIAQANGGNGGAGGGDSIGAPGALGGNTGNVSGNASLTLVSGGNGGTGNVGPATTANGSTGGNANAPGSLSMNLNGLGTVSVSTWGGAGGGGGSGGWGTGTSGGAGGSGSGGSHAGGTGGGGNAGNAPTINSGLNTSYRGAALGGGGGGGGGSGAGGGGAANTQVPVGGFVRLYVA